MMMKIVVRFEIFCHYTGTYMGAAYTIRNLRYKTLKKIPVVFLDQPDYDYDFTTRELREEYDKQFECFRENTEKYITF